MTIRAVVAKTLIACVLAAGAGAFAAPAAFAQHVVTDDEAGKLTLDALTATPRPVVRRVVYRPSADRFAHGRHAHERQHTVAMVHRASYHQSARAASNASHRRRRG